MSLKAGGVGLNLTAASNVFLMVCIVYSLHNTPSAQLLNVMSNYNFLSFCNENIGSMVESCS